MTDGERARRKLCGRPNILQCSGIYYEQGVGKIMELISRRKQNFRKRYKQINVFIDTCYTA